MPRTTGRMKNGIGAFGMWRKISFKSSGCIAEPSA